MHTAWQRTANDGNDNTGIEFDAALRRMSYPKKCMKRGQRLSMQRFEDRQREPTYHAITLDAFFFYVEAFHGMGLLREQW